MHINSFLIYVKTDDIYKDIAEYVETRFDTSNFEIDIPLPKRKKKKVIGLMKYDLGGQIMKEFVALREKTYSYLKAKSDEDKTIKDTKKYFVKRKLKFEDYQNCLEAAQIESKTNHFEKIKLMQIVLKKIKNNS